MICVKTWMMHLFTLDVPVVSQIAQWLKLLCLLCLDVIVLGNGASEALCSVAEFYVKLFRRYRLHRNEREAVWSSLDQLITTQLVAAENNKLVQCHAFLTIYWLCIIDAVWKSDNLHIFYLYSISIGSHLCIKGVILEGQTTLTRLCSQTIVISDNCLWSNTNVFELCLTNKSNSFGSCFSCVNVNNMAACICIQHYMSVIDPFV